jgi:WD40 repeat protein
VFIGYSTGYIRNYEYSNNEFVKLWEIPAHRGNVNCIYVDGNYILSGGEDGILRVWTRKTHELVLQLPAHHKDVMSVLADINKPNLVYTCGGDKNMNCFDIKLGKRANLHSITNGIITGIAQRLSSENEISNINNLNII